MHHHDEHPIYSYHHSFHQLQQSLSSVNHHSYRHQPAQIQIRLIPFQLSLSLLLPVNRLPRYQWPRQEIFGHSNGCSVKKPTPRFQQFH